MDSGNPVLSSSTLKGLPRLGVETMTIQGAVFKTLFSLLILLVAASFTWNQAFTGGPWLAPLLWGGLLGGLAVAIVTVFKKEWAPWTTPLYAALEGLVLGGISALAESAYPGIAIRAVSLTFGVMLALLLAYQAGLIRASAPFRRGLIAATGGILLVYLVSLGLRFFGITNPLVYGNSLLAIGFNLFVVAIAALNLVLDFDLVEQLAASRAPKYMEWYGAFGLMVTLVWLYVEILNLLLRLQGRSRE